MKTKLKITFPASLTDTPLTYLLIKKFDLKVNILKADIDFNNVGHILYEFTGDQDKIQSTIEYIKSLGIACESIKSTIKIDENLCTDCGLCTSVCFSKSLSIGAPDWTLSFDTDKCIGCNHCIPFCPSRAIKEA
ncbi:MAG: 4Fe-4S binding protein [Clostridiales bacterium]|nr:4Fe-4S binding protein [Clostridiales bacterium]